MKFKAWIMFDNHTFKKVDGNNGRELVKAIEAVYNEYPDDSYWIAGWGNVTYSHQSSDEFCIFKGLHNREELKDLPEQVKVLELLLNLGDEEGYIIKEPSEIELLRDENERLKTRIKELERQKHEVPL